MYSNFDENLEEQCEDAVYQIGCTRECYSVRCANQLEKYLGLVTKKQTSYVQVSPIPNFETPKITEDQQKFFETFNVSSKSKKQSNSKTEVKEISSRITELKSILHQIERSANSEIEQLLKANK